MQLTPVLLVHIVGAVLGLLSGFLAIAFRKGSGWHGAAGTVFFASMLVMSATGAWIGAFVHPIMINVVAATLTFYLVSTGWHAAKHRDGTAGLFDVGALLFVLSISAAGFVFGLRGAKDGVPRVAYFIFASVALLCAVSDVRLLVRGGVTGMQRIARHLWRMSLALLFATLSFYPTRARLFPKWLNDSNVLYVPHVLLIGAMLFWIYRVKVRKRLRAERVVTVRIAEVVETRVAA